MEKDSTTTSSSTTSTTTSASTPTVPSVTSETTPNLVAMALAKCASIERVLEALVKLKEATSLPPKVSPTRNQDRVERVLEGLTKLKELVGAPTENLTDVLAAGSGFLEMGSRADLYGMFCNRLRPSLPNIHIHMSEPLKKDVLNANANAVAYINQPTPISSRGQSGPTGVSELPKLVETTKVSPTINIPSNFKNILGTWMGMIGTDMVNIRFEFTSSSKKLIAFHTLFTQPEPPFTSDSKPLAGEENIYTKVIFNHATLTLLIEAGRGSMTAWVVNGVITGKLADDRQVNLVKSECEIVVVEIVKSLSFGFLSPERKKMIGICDVEEFFTSLSLGQLNRCIRVCKRWRGYIDNHPEVFWFKHKMKLTPRIIPCSCIFNQLFWLFNGNGLVISFRSNSSKRTEPDEVRLINSHDFYYWG